MFDTTKEDLKDILRDAHEGRLQLPDFQREYVWGDDDVRSLIASVAKGFPVGALLTLQTGGDVQFKPRLLAGVPAQDTEPRELLLDGQQRITSLYQSTYAHLPVRTINNHKREVLRFYYLDIQKAVTVSADIEDAIIGVPENRIIRKNFGRDIELDLSTADSEFENQMFPLNCVFDIRRTRDWYYGWRTHWKNRGRDVSDIERDLDVQILDKITRYKMPVIRLSRDSKRDAICLVFEKVNVGGKKLDVFELLTATYAAHNFDLRRDWKCPDGKSGAGRRDQILGSPYPRNVLTQVSSTDFLQACSLLHTRNRRLERSEEGLKGRDLPEISCKRDALLDLPLESYRRYADGVEEGMREAAAFLNEQKIIWHKDVPYRALIVGLASTFAILGREAQTTTAKEKIAQWFWCVTLGELYGSSTDTRLARDVHQLVKQIQNQDSDYYSVDEAIFRRERLRSLRFRLSAAYKGIHALLMCRGCRDFSTNRTTEIMTFFNDRIDIHHIFPKKWCMDHDLKPVVFNSIVNKTPLSRASNISIGGYAPSVYLRKIEEQEGVSSDVLDDILRSHLIEPEHLRNDDFDSFFEARLIALSELVEEAMGKPVFIEAETDEEERDSDLADDENAELEDAA